MTDTLIVMCARSPPCPLVLLRGRERRACVADWSVGHSWSYVGLCHCARCPGRPCKAEPVRGVGGEEAEPRRAAFLPHPATRKSGRRGRGAKPKQIFDLHSGITRDRFVRYIARPVSGYNTQQSRHAAHAPARTAARCSWTWYGRAGVPAVPAAGWPLGRSSLLVRWLGRCIPGSAVRVRFRPRADSGDTGKPEAGRGPNGIDREAQRGAIRDRERHLP